MASSGYVADTFVAGEQPTTAKWNELWGNDASFNTGNGFNDAILATRHFGANVVQSIALALSNALDSTNGVKSQANAGSAGGTMYYINLGGIKLLWCQTATWTVTTGNDASHDLTLPAAFFSTIQSVLATTNGVSATAFDTWVPAIIRFANTTTVEVGQHNFGGGTAGALGAFVLVIGT